MKEKFIVQLEITLESDDKTLESENALKHGDFSNIRFGTQEEREAFLIENCEVINVQPVLK